jgi:hypothetical protein
VTFPHVAPAAVDVAIAVRRRLVSVPGVVACLGPAAAVASGDVWLYVRELGTLPEGSGLAAAVVAIEGPWTRPNDHNTARFPRLALHIYADCTRDVSGAIVRKDAEARAWATWEPFNRELDRKDGFSEMWGVTSTDPGLRVWGSRLLSLPDVYDVQDWDGGKRLQVHYALNVG